MNFIERIKYFFTGEHIDYKIYNNYEKIALTNVMLRGRWDFVSFEGKRVLKTYRNKDNGGITATTFYLTRGRNIVIVEGCFITVDRLVEKCASKDFWLEHLHDNLTAEELKEVKELRSEKTKFID